MRRPHRTKNEEGSSFRNDWGKVLALMFILNIILLIYLNIILIDGVVLLLFDTNKYTLHGVECWFT